MTSDQVNKTAIIIVAARCGFRSGSPHAFANGFIEAIASGKFDCINISQFTAICADFCGVRFCYACLYTGSYSACIP